MKIATSRYYNPALKTAACQELWVPVRTSIGAPRWGVEYPLTEALLALAPSKEMLAASRAGTSTWEEFATQMRARLASYGVGGVFRTLEQIATTHRRPGVVLLCYEDIRLPGEHCHREILREWFLGFGIDCEELADPSIPKKSRPPAKARAVGTQLGLPGEPAGPVAVEALSGNVVNAVGKALQRLHLVIARDGDTFTVRSSSTDETYAVAIDAEGHARCTCKAGQSHTACWHAAAALQRHAEGWGK